MLSVDLGKCIDDLKKIDKTLASDFPWKVRYQFVMFERTEQSKD